MIDYVFLTENYLLYVVKFTKENINTNSKTTKK